MIERSSGAIANAWDELVSQGLAEQVSDRPRTYRPVTPQADVQPGRSEQTGSVLETWGSVRSPLPGLETSTGCSSPRLGRRLTENKCMCRSRPDAGEQQTVLGHFEADAKRRRSRVA
ncbi:hypothetical protein GCM10010358_27320 [Streptomyces minutiscleroticus]|uniref:Uncharacterized protein n=1 Tax=Streptomyces minutiscleroticus TaxID=68238 RepID=A0A918KPW0_9ACTN|nr:hypothetical protein [Streptomyces minutiscleroticus]GGX71577.1 hypothetical protein GCM10010358_27320 [Streptomyces minutiscleroticus]